MSEVQTRGPATRGRGSARGGRGGFGARGGRTSRTNGEKEITKPDIDAADDEGDIAELRKLYGNKTSLVKDVFPDWSEIDILFALQETEGDGDLTVTRIMDGSISQWGEVSKSKKAPRAKAKDAPAGAPTDSNARPPRGNRNVSDGGRGRGRGSERGARAPRGRATQATTNGHRSKEPLSVPTEESSAWDTEKVKADLAEPEKTSPVPKPAAPAPAQKTWASMLRQSTVPKPAPKPKEAPPPKPAEPLEPLPPAEPVTIEPEPAVEEPEAPVEKEPEPDAPKIIEPEIALPPPKDQLTETNLEQIMDTSNPAATGTAASTAADSWDPRQTAVSATATPISASQQQHQAPRPAAAPVAPSSASGFATSAIKATTERAVRTPSYRRKLDQEEAVRMPGNREVERTAVQFGSLGLNGAEDDIDGDREEPETRAQPPDDSPVAHPRTSLPPVSQPTPVPEAAPVQKPAPALPTPPTASAAPTAPAAQAPVPAQAPAAPQSAQQFSRFGPAGASQEPSSYTQKPFEPFGQQNPAAAQSQFESFPNQASQTQTQQPAGAFSSAPSEFSNYYTADPQNRSQYSYYSQQYGHQQPHQQAQQAQTQTGQGAQDSQPAPQPQRSFGGYNASQPDNLSQYPQSGIHQQSRYGAAVSSDAHNSGHTTPNPSTQQGPASQSQPHGQQPHSNYGGYNHPYYNHPYYANYMYGQGGYNQSGYGGGPYGKAGMYGQPYGMSSSGPYDHSSSQVGGFGGQSSLHRGAGAGGDASLSSGLGDFGRSGAGQTGAQQGIAGSGFGGGVHDPFGRNTSATFQSQAGQGFGSAAQPTAAGVGNDDLKPFGDAKAGVAGPSPSLGSAARPGSATQNAPSGPASLPPQQSSAQMGGYGGYPSHLQHGGLHGSGYGMGGTATSGQQHNTPYSAYGQGGFGSYYQQQGGAQGGQGGQGGQGQGQQRGWGGNYH